MCIDRGIPSRARSVGQESGGVVLGGHRLILATVAASFAFTAYAGWEKSGATPEQLKKDQSQCEMRARSDADFSRIDPGPPGTRAGATLRGANTMAQQTRYFELCMRERGYEWVDAKAPAKKE